MLPLDYHLASEFNPAAFCFLHKNTAAVALKNVHRRWLLVRFSFLGSTADESHLRCQHRVLHPLQCYLPPHYYKE